MTITIFRQYSIFLIAIVGLLACSDSTVDDSPADALFKLLDSRQTGITFSNDLVEGPNMNILMYEYFYNGGGVATSDLNGDGYLDLYFSSNMGENKIYLHTGEEGTISYRDVSDQTTATGRPGPWKTGVNIVDINGDGAMDIYLCYSGTLSPQKRRNQLYLHKGNNADGIPQYEERALAYGLAGTAYSNQAYFWDYDRDGDLDMLMLNHNPKNLPILNEAQSRSMLLEQDPQMGVRLYQNNNNRYTDVTAAAGINGSALSYGLAIGISDMNDDGWPDFYVSNDYQVPDFLYLNDQDGTFSNAIDQLGHTSQFSMGNDIADVNHDGLPDIITLDMLPADQKRQNLLLAPDDYSKFDLNVRSDFGEQYMRNMLHINNGDGSYSEVGQLMGMSNTDWSWSSLSADFDLDGSNDLYVTNGYTRDYTNQDFINYMDDFVQRKGRLQREEVLEIIEHMPASDLSNHMLQATGDIGYTDVTKAWGLGQTANSNGAIYADLDNDGDLDIITNNINKKAFIYENKSVDRGAQYLQISLKGKAPNTQAIGAKVSVITDQKSYRQELYPARGYLSAVTPILNFGIPNGTSIKEVKVHWPSGQVSSLSDVSPNQRIAIEEASAKGPSDHTISSKETIYSSVESPINYKHPERKKRDFDRQRLLLYELSHQGPAMISGDINGDGREDIVIGGAAGQSTQIFLQRADGSYATRANVALDNTKASETTAVTLIDVDGDGDLDLYEAHGGYHDWQQDDIALQDQLYLNDGLGRYSLSSGALPEMKINSQVVLPIDANSDGRVDLFVGGYGVPGRYPESHQSLLLINDGAGQYTDQTKNVAPAIASLHLVTDAVTADIDADGDQDLIVTQEWGSIQLLINDDKGLTTSEKDHWSPQLTGLWQSIETEDLNNDGMPDFIIGNLGLNTQLKASSSEPIELYYDDYDDNGSIDPMITSYVQGKRYPFMTRGELLNQLAQYRSTFTSYESYAEAQLEDLLSAEQINGSSHLSVTELRSGILLSAADGSYTWSTLPTEAQYAPIYDIQILDYDKDGIKDLLLTGNNHRMKLRLGQIDANYGQLYRGLGDGQYNYIPQRESGISIRGDVRSSVQIRDQIIFGRNQDQLTTYQINR